MFTSNLSNLKVEALAVQLEGAPSEQARPGVSSQLLEKKGYRVSKTNNRTRMASNLGAEALAALPEGAPLNRHGRRCAHNYQ